MGFGERPARAETRISMASLG